MIILNFLPTFSWTSGVNKDGYAKASIGGESFWIKNCREIKLENKPRFEGVIDNHLINTAVHGLNYGDKVAFVPTNID